MVTLKLSLFGIVLAFLLGGVAAVARVIPWGPLRVAARAYVEFFRNTPLIAQLFFWYFGVPALLPESAREWLAGHDLEFLAALAGLTTYTGAYIAEVMRAGIEAVPREQWEAAASSGLSLPGILRLVILPQAFRIILPPLGSQFLNLIKNSSLAMTIGVAEVTFQSQAIEAQTFKGFEATTAATLLYLLLTLVTSALVSWTSRRLALPGGSVHA